MSDKKYNPFKIPDFVKYEKPAIPPEKPKTTLISDGVFYEIEYDSSPISGVGKIVMKTPAAQKLTESADDPIRDLFYQMREIARAHRSNYEYLRFFDRRVQYENAAIFYKQAIFMKDFSDNFDMVTSFSQYYPYYQMMGYEQLRTYFTWRTMVRQGDIRDTSLSYAYLYIYELLSNVGVDNPQDGLDKLIAFWRAFSRYNKSIDKYMIGWIKDYHIYYELPDSLYNFALGNDLTKYFQNESMQGDDYMLFCSISKYNIAKSAFFTQHNDMLKKCFEFVIARIKSEFTKAGMTFDSVFYRPTRKVVPWSPFKDALFFNWKEQADRCVVFSDKEIYFCRGNKWFFSALITSENGRQFAGYVLKKMESVMRGLLKHKYKLSAETDMINADTLRKLQKSGIFIDKIVTQAVIEYRREATKTVVTVDHTALERIRQEALATQEALIVEEEAVFTPDQSVFVDAVDEVASDPWEGLKNALSQVEVMALQAIMIDADIKEFADSQGIMLEVLIDGINEKSMDFVGDSILDDEFFVYDDYIEQVKGLIT